MFWGNRVRRSNKIKLATFLLHGSAEDWWTIRNECRSYKVCPMGRFTKGFKEKFYPRLILDTKMKDFLSLKQGDMIITEYERKFMKIAKYAMSYVVDEKEKSKRFKEGLRTTIRMPVTSSTNWLTISRLVEAAMRVESTLAKEKKSSKEKRLGKEPMQTKVASYSVHQVSRGGPIWDKGKWTIEQKRMKF